MSAQDIPYIERFQPSGFEDYQKNIIAGALNLRGVGNLLRADTQNLTVFTWEQVDQALRSSRQDCIGDALDDLDDTIIAVRQERKSYVN